MQIWNLVLLFVVTYLALRCSHSKTYSFYSRCYCQLCVDLKAAPGAITESVTVNQEEKQKTVSKMQGDKTDVLVFRYATVIPFSPPFHWPLLSLVQISWKSTWLSVTSDISDVILTSKIPYMSPIPSQNDSSVAPNFCRQA